MCRLNGADQSFSVVKCYDVKRVGGREEGGGKMIMS